MKLEDKQTTWHISINFEELNKIYWALRQCECSACLYSNCPCLSGGSKNCRQLASDLMWETAEPK